MGTDAEERQEVKLASFVALNCGCVKQNLGMDVQDPLQDAAVAPAQ